MRHCWHEDLAADAQQGQNNKIRQNIQLVFSDAEEYPQISNIGVSKEAPAGSHPQPANLRVNLCLGHRRAIIKTQEPVRSPLHHLVHHRFYEGEPNRPQKPE